VNDGWFTETLYPDFQQRLQISKVLFETRTEFQHLLIFENPRFGRVMALDGVVQTTERDEFCYHEMLAHVPILAHGGVRRVAIVGGGDGGALREVLKHDVERAVMVEIDRGVVDVCQEYMPTLSAGAFDDPRHELIIADGIKFMKESDETFDVIIVDSTDPEGPAVPLFGEEFYSDCRDRLSEQGILITQSGVTFMQEQEARGTHARMNALFTDASLYLTQVPTYGAGYMTLGWGCRDTAPRRTPLAEIERRFASAAIETRYYSPAVHLASFALPGYIRSLTG
jgi:spermidine synthase